MKVPRDVSGLQLVRALQRFGYVLVRQTGSHARLTTTQHGTHHVTVPMKKAMRIGTLTTILHEVADHAGMTRDELRDALNI